MGRVRAKLQLWDISGSRRYRSLSKVYFKGCKVFVVMYDITSRESFEGVMYWVNTIREKSDTGPSSAVLVGNKSDMEE